MAFRSAQSARIYVGHLRASAYARSGASSAKFDMHDVTTLDDEEQAFIPGHDTSTFDLSGPLDTDATSNGQYDAITDLQTATTATPITYMPLGTDGAAWLIEAWQTTIDVTSSAQSTADWTMTAQTTGQTDYNGAILENATTVTTDTDGTTVDNGAATTNGGYAHLHVTAYSGLTSDAIIIEGSTTGAFAGEETTIVTFASVTAIGSERVAATGTVPRYLRVADNVTGTGSITRLVAFSRR